MKTFRLNKKIVLLFSMLLFTSFTLCSQTLPTATEIVSNMTIGWNHGNSLEVPDGETAWGNAAATQQLIDGVKAAGFNTVRLPCAWDSYANQSTYVIDTSWLARVKEVVDYCYNNNMYVIINSHWDNGWLEEHPFYANQVEVNAKQQAYWTQIANYFSDYDDHLLFSGTNEVRADYAEPTSEYIEVQESYNQTFVDAVRATGGNNQSRTLIVQTYNTNIWHGINYFTLPNDSANDRLIVEVHHYDSYEFTILEGNSCPKWDEGNCSWANASYIEDMFSQVQQKWINNGIPVIIGEYGARKKEGADDAERLEYLEFTTGTAKQHGIIPMYWDNGYATEFGLFERSNGTITDQVGIDALMAGAGVNPGQTYTLSTSANGSGSVSVSPNNSTYQSGTQVTLTATANSGYIFTGWSGSLTGSVNPVTVIMNANKTITANFIEEVPGGGSGTILREYWSDISGSAISDLTSNANYPDAPSGSEEITSLEGPTTFGNNYGTRISGYIHPSITGDYTFWIAGDDNADLYLSTGESPSNTSRIAYVEGWTDSQEWNKYTSQESSSISLVAGNKYYIEVLHKEGSGGDNIAVSWSGPGISQSVIDGSFLSPYEDGGSGDINVTGVSLNTSSITLNSGQTAQLTATITPSNATNQSLNWSSSNTAIATVNSSGVVTTISEGTTTVSVSTVDGNYIASATITVSSSTISVTGIAISPTTVTIEEGQTTQLTATISPSNASNKNVNWSSNNTSIATVGTNGTVTGILQGTVSITVTSVDGGYSANTIITVEESTGGNETCNAPVSISLPFVQEGTGTYCWASSGTITYINNWGLDTLEINGVDYTNAWSDSMPAKINGNYYFYYVSSSPWSHFEANGAEVTTAMFSKINRENEVLSNALIIYPNPVKSNITIKGSLDIDSKLNIVIYNQIGQVVLKRDLGLIKKGAFAQNIRLNRLQLGLYFIQLTTGSDITTTKFVKK